MAPELFTIKKRATFVHVRNNGVFIRSKNINVQKLINQDLDNKIGIGYTATKKIGKFGAIGPVYAEQKKRYKKTT